MAKIKKKKEFMKQHWMICQLSVKEVRNRNIAAHCAIFVKMLIRVETTEFTQLK